MDNASIDQFEPAQAVQEAVRRKCRTSIAQKELELLRSDLEHLGSRTRNRLQAEVSLQMDTWGKISLVENTTRFSPNRDL